MMQYAKHGDRYVVRLDEGEEVMETMRAFLAERDIRAGYFLAWGGFSELTIKYYRVDQHDYKERRIAAQVEVVSLLGNVGRLDGEPIIHAHTTVGDEEYRTYGGPSRRRKGETAAGGLLDAAAGRVAAGAGPGAQPLTA